MRHRYHLAIDDTLTGGPIHRSRECDDLDDSVKPVATTTVENNDLPLCPTCCDTDDAPRPPADTKALLAEDICPWCSDYDGEHVGRHASRAHPQAWSAWREE